MIVRDPPPVLSVRRWLAFACVAASLVGLAAACAERREVAAPGWSAEGLLRGPPFMAWLEGERAHGLTLVVVPTRALVGSLAVRAEGGGARREALLGARGGRLGLGRAAGDERVRVEVSWRDPRGVTGARAVLTHGTDGPVVTPTGFSSIPPLPVGRHGATVEEAIRIR